MPSELVRQFTLLREVDAKYSGTLHLFTLLTDLDLQTRISSEIDTFLTSSATSMPHQRGQRLFNITHLLTSALGCADEKVSVASSAADISEKHKLRLDSDFEKLEQGEISELIRFGSADHPAFVHGSTMGMSRSESRRLAIAQAKKNEEELQDWRKEQIGRRGQLVANEETLQQQLQQQQHHQQQQQQQQQQKARGAARKKAMLAATGGQVGNGIGSVGGVSNVGGGRGTPPRGGTPVGAGGDMKKSHHKKKPPRGDDENPG